MLSSIQAFLLSVREVFFPPQIAEAYGLETAEDKQPPLLEEARTQIFTATMRLVFLVTLLAYFIFLYRELATAPGQAFIYGIMLAGLGIVTFAPQLSLQFRVVLAVSIMFVIAANDIASFGMSNDGRLYLFMMVIFTLVLMGGRAGAIAVLIGTALVFGLGILFSRGVITAPHSTFSHAEFDSQQARYFAVNFLLVTGLTASSVFGLLRFIERAWQRERWVSNALERSLGREQMLAQQLEDHLKQERQISDLRAQVMANVSHEFRTPLSIISNSNTLLSRHMAQMSDEKRLQHLGTIQQEVDNLSGLVEGIELVRKLNASQFDVILQQFETGQLCKAVKRGLELSSPEPRRLQFEATDGFIDDYLVQADPEVLQHICNRLLDNALKYSAGPVTITYDTSPDALEISVTDLGDPIPLEEQSKIFELLERGSNAEHTDGLGIGLFIATQLAEKLNANVALESLGQEQLSNIFTVTLPLVTP